MDAWKNAFFLQEKPMSIKFLVLGGGGILGFFGGGVPIKIFMGARMFLKLCGPLILADANRESSLIKITEKGGWV